MTFDLNTWAQRLLHVALIIGAAYLSAHPQYAWAIPAMQALGQAIPQPK